MASGPKGPSKEEKAATERLQATQAEQMAALDDEENRRIKKLILGGRGARGYRGSPMLRARPSDSAGRTTPVTGGRGASAGGANGVAASLLRGAGARGGTARNFSNVSRS